MPTLYPQIDSLEARRLLNEYRELASVEFSPKFSSPRQTFSPVGGARVHDAALIRLREGVVGIADRAGWPRDVGADGRRRFDRDLAKELHARLGMTAHEASRPGVWRFLCCAVLPDVVSWRFPAGSESAVEARFLGGNRNALGRLWWRAEVLRDDLAADPYHLLDALMEDELVQLMERPSIARCKPVAKALAKGFVAVFSGGDSRSKALGRMELMRDAAKRILRSGAVIAFDVLDDDQAAAIARVELAHACAALLDRHAPQQPDSQPAPSVSLKRGSGSKRGWFQAARLRGGLAR